MDPPLFRASERALASRSSFRVTDAPESPESGFAVTGVRAATGVLLEQTSNLKPGETGLGELAKDGVHEFWDLTFKLTGASRPCGTTS